MKLNQSLVTTTIIIILIVLTIVGNKADRAKYRQIEVTEGETYAKSVGAKFFEVSAKTGDGKIIFSYLSTYFRAIRPELTWLLNLGIEEAFFEIAKELKDSNPEPLVDEVMICSELRLLEYYFIRGSDLCA